MRPSAVSQTSSGTPPTTVVNGSQTRPGACFEDQHCLDELAAEVFEVDAEFEFCVVFADGVGAEAAADVELDDLDDPVRPLQQRPGGVVDGVGVV